MKGLQRSLKTDVAVLSTCLCVTVPMESRLKESGFATQKPPAESTVLTANCLVHHKMHFPMTASATGNMPVNEFHHMNSLKTIFVL